VPAIAARPYVEVLSVTPVVAKNDQATLVAKISPSNAKCNRDLPPQWPVGGERPRRQACGERPCLLDVDGEPEHDLVSDRLMSRSPAPVTKR